MNNLRVGQALWFYAGGHETVLASDQPLLAFVTYVHAHKHNDAKASPLVNLAVFGKEGSLWSRSSVHVWDGEGEAPERGSYARWQEDDAAEAKRADDANAPKRGWGETEDAHKARMAKWHDDRKPDDPAVQADGQAKTNVDHGPPRGSPSPNSGGPLAMDDHDTKPATLGGVPSGGPASQRESDAAYKQWQDEQKARQEAAYKDSTSERPV